MPSEQVWWVGGEEYRMLYEAIPPIDNFTNRNLTAIGAENVGKDPFSDKDIIFPRYTLFPPELYIVREAFNVDSDDVDERAQAEFDLVKIFAEIAIFHSSIPRRTEYTDEIKDILEQRLDFDLRNLPKENPGIDKGQLKSLVQGYHDIINFDEEPLIELEGAAIKYISKIRSMEGQKRDEVLFKAGGDTSGHLSNFLAEKVVRKVLYSLSDEYSQPYQKEIKAKYRNLLGEQAALRERTRLFLNSIGLSTHDAMFQAYRESTIPLKFIEAKKKKKKLVYPV